MHFVSRIATLWIVVWAVAVESRGAEHDPHREVYFETLRRNAIPPTGAGAQSWLRRMQLDENESSRVRQLVSQLGDQDFQTREQATQSLLALENPPVVPLVEAEQSDNAEIAWRAKWVLDRRQPRFTGVALAALKVISYDPPPGVVDDIFAALPFCRHRNLSEAAYEALKAAAGPNDLDLLRRKLRAADPPAQIAAAVALAHVLSGDSLAELYPLLDDPDTRVVLETTRALANAGDRRSLGALVGLLESPDTQIRVESAILLQALTGLRLGFASYDSPQQRADAVRAWRDWLESDGDTAQLKFPIVRQVTARGDLRGHTLISTGSNHKVAELDASGKEVWSFEIDAWSAEKLTNGNVLIGSYTQKRVLEVDPAGNIVWELAGVSAMTAKPLLNGNILVADFSGRRVVEIDRAKRTVWEHATPNECFDCDRLPNGNTIFGCPNLVREVAPDGNTVNEWVIQGRLNGFQALESGNILVANYGQNKVYELSPSGEIIWEIAEPKPCDVYQTPDGRLLVSTAERILEIGLDRTVKREISKSKYGSARQ